jgi:hypothetical protein
MREEKSMGKNGDIAAMVVPSFHFSNYLLALF